MTAAPPPRPGASDPLHRAASLACWRGKVDPQPLGGGITNTNFTVVDGAHKYVVRIGDDIPLHQISRSNELAASKAAFAAGLSPEVIYSEPGALVLRYVDGRTFGAADVRDPRNRDALVDLVRRCHRELPRHFRGPAAIFWVFQVLRDYAHTLREGGSRHLASLPRLLQEADALEAAVGPVEIVFGHNDLLPANILDDGRRLWLVDWDYAGFNSPLFDLGGLASNSELDEASRIGLAEAYFGRALSDDLSRRLAAMTAASLLREAMWSMVSEIHSGLDFDYAAYTAENLRRYEAAHDAWRRM
ncbi:phosphotransferase [Labrys monachus]|uniref:Thiamine kinase-like enzyme n=1 Tax=Labrys monachus TaxID=217067 RepID=A0ABU0FMZ9_9HYPH|nr:phosphotransferase [Labrys monachus]MDQ0395992.1 thiamine kinase-like enzyme [Labrys monachus]